MATYKVIQDIEAEDKFLGPLTLKQFIFGAIGVFFSYLSFFALTKGLTFLLAVFMPPALLGFFLAIPWSSDQPTEVWVLAKLRFRFKPKARIWDQAGMEELVTITAPKKEEKQLTNGLDQTEVESRLQALASTLDTRGWAVKNATLGGNYDAGGQTGERLIPLNTLPREVSESDQFEDMFEDNTQVADKFENMIQASTSNRLQQSLEKMERARRGESLESIRQPQVNFTPPAAAEGSTSNLPADEQFISQQLRNKQLAGDLAQSHLQRVPVYPGAGSAVRPVTPPPADPVQPSQPAPQGQMTNTSDPDILNLAQNNDLNIDTIARQAKRDDAEDEVVISLR